MTETPITRARAWLQEGVPEAEIRQRLLAEGLSAGDVAIVLGNVLPPKVALEDSSTKLSTAARVGFGVLGVAPALLLGVSELLRTPDDPHPISQVLGLVVAQVVALALVSGTFTARFSKVMRRALPIAAILAAPAGLYAVQQNYESLRHLKGSEDAPWLATFYGGICFLILGGSIAAHLGLLMLAFSDRDER